MTKKINIAFAANNNYISHLEVSLYSLLKNNQNNTFNIYVLSSDLTAKSRKKLDDICMYFKNASLEVITVDVHRFNQLKTISHFSRDMYSRYLLPEMLHNKDKVLYLDSDILVTGEIEKLYNINVEDFYVAAALDIGISKPDFHDYLEPLGLDGSKYFNSGVLVMNLKKMRNDSVVEKLINTSVQFGKYLLHPDQDVINIVFRDKIKKLSNIWNFQDEDRLQNLHPLVDVKIIHYTTKWKPWNTPNVLREYNSAVHDLYDNYEYQYYEELGHSKKVSVIIPIFNTRRDYLDECLASIFKQIYKNLEIIMVDDGSENNTAKYLDDLSKTDNRIKVIHKSNAGTNRARQTGFEQSDGDYITFVDSDDCPDSTMILKLFRACRTDAADMSVCEFWDNGMEKTLNPWINNDRIIEGRDEISRCRYVGFSGVRVFTGVVWAKLYERNIISNIDWDFSDYALTEDEFMDVQIFAYAKRASLVREQLYFYRRYDTSKELNYPKRNIFMGNKIPMVQTARDLYEKSKATYNEKNIHYNPTELLVNYIAVVSNQAYKIALSGNLDKENLNELLKQRKMYLPTILNNDAVTLVQKVRAIMAFDSPVSVELFNDIERMYDTKIHTHNLEIIRLGAEMIRLQAENQEFLGLKRSAKLFAGNIKRKVKRFIK